MNIRPLVNEIRNQKDGARIALALEQTQAQLDELSKRAMVVEAAVDDPSPEVSMPAPGHVTDLVVSCDSLAELRGQAKAQISATFKAPIEEDYNGFDGVEYFHRDANGEIIKSGWLPLDTLAGEEASIGYEIDAPVNEELQTIYVVARSGDVTADYETAPSAEVSVVAGGIDGSLGNVTVVGSAVKTWLASGDLRVAALRAADSGYLPPYIRSSTSVGEFLGVDLFWERDSDPESPYSAGSPPYTGNPDGVGTARLGEVYVVIPRGFVVVGTHYLILRSYGKSQRLGWKPHTLLPATTYFVVTVTAEELTANPSDGTTPGAPTGVTPFIKPGRTALTYFPGVRFSPPAVLGGTVGYSHHYRFWKDAGMTQAHYPTDGTWIEAGFVQGASLVEIVGSEAPRDSETVYMQAGVAPFNERWEQGSYVNSVTAVAVTPVSEAVAGQSASVAITIEAGADSRSYYVAATLAPPSPLGGATQWRAQLGFFDAETGGTQTHPYTPLGGNLEIYDTTEDFGPFTRGVDEAPWASLIAQLIYADGSTSGWFSAARKQVGKQVAPAATLVNLSTLETATVSGKPSFRITKKATFSGSKDAMDWTDVRVWFYTNAGGTALDGEVELGGLDPKVNETWPITVEQKTDWWDRPTYDVWYKIGIRAKNSDGVWGSWVYTALAALSASAGFDAGGADPASLSDRLLLDPSTGKLDAYALTELAKWGLSADDFEASGGNLVIKAAVIERLLTGSLTIGSNLTFNRDGSVFTLNSGSIVMTVGGTGLSLDSGGDASFSGGVQFNGQVIANAGLGVLTGTLSVNGALGGVFEVTNYSSATFSANSSLTLDSASVTIGAGAKANWRSELGLGTMAVKDVGATGSFTTVDGKTVTVTDGIITAIV